ncbi:MAG: hypothetical protein MUF49_26215 [Oculatellaceae cyanobacterium Prado106]|jgi:hypothetical protein|nr:hypothetical protein [Oculatellaceae cyanobacterium Prado106]
MRVKGEDKDFVGRSLNFLARSNGDFLGRAYSERIGRSLDFPEEVTAIFLDDE